MVTHKEWLLPLHNSGRQWTKLCSPYLIPEVSSLRSTISKHLSPLRRYSPKIASIILRWYNPPKCNKISKIWPKLQPLSSARCPVSFHPKVRSALCNTPSSFRTSSSSRHKCQCHNSLLVRRPNLTVANLLIGGTSATRSRRKMNLVRRIRQRKEARASKVQQRLKWPGITPQVRMGASRAVRYRKRQTQAR